ncbi:MAG: DUF1643 domain-containing protein [Desulfuromonas sp.]|nr:MAG: DUF1643 domain-containing protein [Desulfuromonas sp.]
MAVTFIPASSLKQQYRVLGHFYWLNVQGTEPLKCRSVLEITHKDASCNPEADAVFVMMNPGSSRPIDETNHLVDSCRISGMMTQLVPTVPDTTQYQVMRVMHYSGWEHVRVLNLSDLRDPQSGSFAERFVRLEEQTGSQVHSIFAPERSLELEKHLSRKSKAPIVCAWGVSDNLNPLIERATGMLVSESPVMGLAKPGQHGKYFHPLPSLQRQKEQWVRQMLEQLNAT